MLAVLGRSVTGGGQCARVKGSQRYLHEVVVKPFAVEWRTSRAVATTADREQVRTTTASKRVAASQVIRVPMPVWLGGPIALDLFAGER